MLLISEARAIALAALGVLLASAICTLLAILSAEYRSRPAEPYLRAVRGILGQDFGVVSGSPGATGKPGPSDPVESPPKAPKVVFLEFFRYLVPTREGRKIVELIRADLMKDAREMQEKGRSAAETTTVVAWRSGVCATQIIWAGVVKVLSAVTPIAWLIRQIRGA
ncbi:MAG: hypothetical protein ACYS99_04990 [Planctomycetota bacterium]|jgi:hypothetical protein